MGLQKGMQSCHFLITPRGEKTMSRDCHQCRKHLFRFLRGLTASRERGELLATHSCSAHTRVVHISIAGVRRTRNVSTPYRLYWLNFLLQWVPRISPVPSLLVRRAVDNIVNKTYGAESSFGGLARVGAYRGCFSSLSRCFPLFFVCFSSSFHQIRALTTANLPAELATSLPPRLHRPVRF